MTIDEAIKYNLDIADGQDKCAEISVSEHAKERISQCAADHRQLAEWLTELKELEAKHWDECRQIAHYDDEIKKLEAADVKHGRWKYYKNNGIIDTYICTNCENKVEMAIDIEPSSFCYCPKCGARMLED